MFCGSRQKTKDVDVQLRNKTLGNRRTLRSFKRLLRGESNASDLRRSAFTSFYWVIQILRHRGSLSRGERRLRVLFIFIYKLPLNQLKALFENIFQALHPFMVARSFLIFLSSPRVCKLKLCMTKCKTSFLVLKHFSRSPLVQSIIAQFSESLFEVEMIDYRANPNYHFNYRQCQLYASSRVNNDETSLDRIVELTISIASTPIVLRRWTYAKPHRCLDVNQEVRFLKSRSQKETCGRLRRSVTR